MIKNDLIIAIAYNGNFRSTHAPPVLHIISTTILFTEVI